MNFSVVMIAKNEAATLPRLLECLKEFRKRGGEVVLVDTGSTDGTVKLAEESCINVLSGGPQFMHTVLLDEADDLNNRFIVKGEPPAIKAGDRFFDYSAARNFAGQQASNNWIFMPDCDETLPHFDIDALEQMIAQPDTEQILCNYVYSSDEYGNPLIQFDRERFYDRRKVRWVNFIHEHPVGNAAKIKRAPESVLSMEHHPQHQGHASDLPGLMVDLRLNPNNDRNTHYLARELMFSGRYRSAICQFQRHIEMPAWPIEQAQSLIYIGECCQKLGDDEQALECWHRAFAKDPTRREALIRLAEYYYTKPGHAGQCAAYAAASLTVPLVGYYMNNLRHYGAVPHEMLYASLWWLGDKEGSTKHWQEALCYEPKNPKYLEDGERHFAEVIKKIPIADWAEKWRELDVEGCDTNGATIPLGPVAWVPDPRMTEVGHSLPSLPATPTQSRKDTPPADTKKLSVRKCLCFISSKEFLPQTMLAAESAQRCNPKYFAVLLTDAAKSEYGGIFDHVLNPSDLGLSDVLKIWGVVGRPRIMQYALEARGFDIAVFLDGDTYTYGPFVEVEREIAAGASMLVTPHTMVPYPDDGKWPRMQECLNLAGNYNSGFFAATPAALPFIRWWGNQTAAYPQIDPAKHLYSEQSWLRYALDFDPRARLLRHPGYNVAFWNICDRDVKPIECWDHGGYPKDYTVNGDFLRVMHFAGGFKKDTPPERMTPYQDRHVLAPDDPRLQIYKDYQELLP